MYLGGIPFAQSAINVIKFHHLPHFSTCSSPWNWLYYKLYGDRKRLRTIGLHAFEGFFEHIICRGMFKNILKYSMHRHLNWRFT
jgi:hypothetical protein